MITLKDFTPGVPNFTLPKVRLVLVVVRPAMPAPVSEVCWGLVAALSAKVRVALCAPTAFGVNATPSVQLVLGATVIGIAPQVPVPLKAYSESDDVTLETSSGWAPPVLWTATVFTSV